jgi:hypothetical protein
MDSELLSATLPENLAPALAEKLKLLAPGTYCSHRSWGFGKIKDWDAAHESVIIDFKAKAGHVMQFAYAAESLTPLAPDHVSVQKVEALDALKKKAAEDPVAVIKDCIRSLGAQATADNIQALLSPDVISAADYKKWWEGAKRALKKDGHFYVPGKKTEALRQLDAPSALGDSALENLRLANGPKAILPALTGLAKYWPEIKSDSVLQEIAELLEATISKIPKSQLPMQIELALARDEFFSQAGRSHHADPASRARAQHASRSTARFAPAETSRGPPHRPARDVAAAFPRPAPARQRPRRRSDHRGLPGRQSRIRRPGRSQPLHPRAQHHLRFSFLAV